MKILVIGGFGQLGNLLVKKLLEQEYHVKVLKVLGEKSVGSLKELDLELYEEDILEKTAIEYLFEGIDAVYYLGEDISFLNERDLITGTKNIAELALKYQTKRFILHSIYHALDKRPHGFTMNESRPLALDEEIPYFRLKAYIELEVIKVIKQGLNATIINSGILIGPYEYKLSELGKGLVALHKQQKKRLFIKGASNYTDIRDVVYGMIEILQHKEVEERYFLTGHMKNLIEIVNLIEKFKGKKRVKLIIPFWLMKFVSPFLSKRLKKEFEVQKVFRTTRPDLIISYKKAKSHLNYNPRDFEDSLNDTFQWYHRMGWLP